MSYSIFKPPTGIASGHLQTILGSTLRKPYVNSRAKRVRAAEQEQLLTAKDGARLVAWVSEQAKPAATVVIIHGWLGTHNSGYNLSLAQKLWQQGYNVVRLNLRDHGGTSHLNEGMFHNGLIEEVADVVSDLQGTYGDLGVAGFSLGGNFALRLAKHLRIPALGICPLMDPAASVAMIDQGSTVYKKYFMRKWLAAMDEKSAHFPKLYDFHQTGAYQVKTVHGMTEHFIDHYTDYADLQSYYDCYTLTGSFLDGVEAAILAAEDDPVVPAEGFRNLPQSLNVKLTAHGGHCAYIDSYRMTSFADGYAAEFFHRKLPLKS